MPSILEVVGIGFGTVFVGLICIIVLISIMNAVFSTFKPKAATDKTVADPAVSSANADEKMDSETVAAVSAAIAETLGRDVSGIRITSIKKVN